MTAYTGFVDNTSMLAHYKMLEKIRDVCLAEGHTILRYDTSITNRELIVRAPGLSGTEQIFFGFYCYHDVANDYYNMACATFTGYVSGNSFLTQPNISQVCGACAHNVRIDYWIRVNGQCINIGMKVGSPVYESMGCGKFFPYATAGQYPQPLFVCGTLVGAVATRYSDTSHSMGWKGNRNNLKIFNNAGAWINALTYPWTGNFITNVRPNEPNYALVPVELMDATNVYGKLDGIFFITGFSNSVESTLTISSKNYVALQDIYRTSFSDYFVMELS